MTKVLRALLMLLMLTGASVSTVGCSAKEPQIVRPADPQPPARARPAVPLSEERAWHEKAGEVLFIIVAGALIIGGIVGSAIAIANL